MSGETPLAPSEGFSDLRSEVVERGAAPEKRKRGRPSNAERAARGETITKPSLAKPAEPVEIIPTETIIEVVALPFALIAARRGSHWNLSDDEKKQIGILTNKVLSKHSPEWLKAWGDEIGLATVLGFAIIGRVMVDMNEAKQINDAAIALKSQAIEGRPDQTFVVPDVSDN